MKFFNTSNKNMSSKNQLAVLIIKIILAITVIQILRALIMCGLWFAVKPGENIVLFQSINGISFIIVGLLLLAWFKPSLKDLSLNWDDITKRSRILYILLGLILLMLLFLPVVLGFELDMVVMGFVFGVIVPLFEELLFRGYLWNKVDKSIKDQRSGLITWIIITLLFALWHIGYLDVFLIHPGQKALFPIIIGKMGVGLVLGFIVGFIRLKTGKVYGAFFFHAFWNIFAP